MLKDQMAPYRARTTAVVITTAMLTFISFWRAGAIVLWNTTYLQAARMHLANLGRPVPPDLLQHLSPLGWQHINLTGDYLWTDPDAPSTALRPLRQMRAVEGTAKP